MPKAHQTFDVVCAVRRLLIEAGATVALWIGSQGKARQLCAACYLPGDGWFSLDGKTPFNEMVELLKQSQIELAVEQLDHSTEASAEVRAMQVRLGLLVELG